MLTKETRLTRSRNKKDELYANIKIVVNLRPGRQGRIVDPNDYNNRGLCEICPDGFFDERIAAVDRASDQARPAFVESPENLRILNSHARESRITFDNIVASCLHASCNQAVALPGTSGKIYKSS